MGDEDEEAEEEAGSFLEESYCFLVPAGEGVQQTEMEGGGWGGGG